MTTHTLRRWGAILLTGGLCLTVAYLILPSDPHSAVLRPAAAIGLVGILLALPGVVAFQQGQSARAPVNGWAGASLTVLALALLEVPHLVLGTFSPASLYDLDAYHSGTWGQLEFGGLVLLPIALVVLAVGTWRSGTYPRWAAWLLFANVAVGALDSLVVPVGEALHAPAPNYLLMGLLGLAMIGIAKEHPADVAPVGRPDPATSVPL